MDVAQEVTEQWGLLLPLLGEGGSHQLQDASWPLVVIIGVDWHGFRRQETEGDGKGGHAHTHPHEPTLTLRVTCRRHMHAPHAGAGARRGTGRRTRPATRQTGVLEPG